MTVRATKLLLLNSNTVTHVLKGRGCALQKLARPQMEASKSR